MKKNKPLTLTQYVDYRNKLLIRRDARRKNFSKQVNYYDIRIEEIDRQYPQFSGLGKIKLKG